MSHKAYFGLCSEMGFFFPSVKSSAGLTGLFIISRVLRIHTLRAARAESIKIVLYSGDDGKINRGKQLFFSILSMSFYDLSNRTTS